MNTKININEAGPNGNVSWMGQDRNGKKWEDYETIKCPNGQIIDMTKLLDEQQRAKAALVHIIPWFGGIINKLRVIYTFHVDTQATDGYNLFINPQFTYNLDLTGKVFVMAHELIHCLLNHMRRGKGHDPERSNIAADYECNITLSDLDYGLFKYSTIENMKAYIDKKYLKKGYEFIYNDISKKSDSNMNNSDEANKAEQNQDNKSNKQNNNSSNNNSAKNDKKQEYSEDYKKGWAQAIEDYKKGKIKI